MKCSVKRFGEATDEELKACDLIIVASGTYAGRMPLIGFLEMKWELIKDKRMLALAVGIAPEDVGCSRKSYESIPAYIRRENLRRVIEYVRSLGTE